MVSCLNAEEKDVPLLFKLDSWKYALDEETFVGTVLIDRSKVFVSMLQDLSTANVRARDLSNDTCNS